VLGSYAAFQEVRPLPLNEIAPHTFLSVRRRLADIADLPLMLIVSELVPALAGDGIGDGFTEFVGTGEGEEIELAEAGGAGHAERLDGVEDVPANRVVVAPKLLAGNVRAQTDRRPGGEVNFVCAIDANFSDWRCPSRTLRISFFSIISYSCSFAFLISVAVSLSRFSTE